MNSRYYIDDDGSPVTGFWSHFHRTFLADSLRSTFDSDSTRYTVATLIGIYVLYTALNLLGFPVLQMAASLIGSSDERTSDMQASGGKVLSNVFGLNNGLLGKGVRGVTGALSKTYGSNAPAGLGNWDNSCYQNSVIQGLASLPSLRNYLDYTTEDTEHFGADSTNMALLEMIDKLHNPEHKGQHFWVKGILKSMSTWQQQDAQEYYSKIMDALDKEVQKAAKKNSQSDEHAEKPQDDMQAEATEQSKETQQSENPSSSTYEREISPNPLDGLLAQRVGCINCGYTEGLSMIPFNCITVPLGRAYHFDVRDCLDEYMKLEYIEGVECAKCTLLRLKNALAGLVGLATTPESKYALKLQAVEEALEENKLDDKTLETFGISKKNYKQTTKSRQAVIARAPKALVLHVNRSIFDEMTGAQLKNSASVSYPPVLDLGNWCLGSQPSESQKPDAEVEERWPKDPNVSMIATDDELMTTSPFQYRLRATITHFGSHGSGHYVCFRQQTPSVTSTVESSDSEDADDPKKKSDSWWRFSDESVREVSEEMALNQGGVFMLFYERIDPNAEPPLEAEPIVATLPVTSEDLPPLPTEYMEIGLSSDDLESAAVIALPESETESLSPSPFASPKILPFSPESTVPSTEASSTPLFDQEAGGVYLTHPETPDTIHEDTEMSEADTQDYDSDDAPSTLMTSDDESQTVTEPEEAKQDLDIPLALTPSPHRMRTAGNNPGQGKSGRQSLPMVSAL